MRSVRAFAYATQTSRAALAIALSFAGMRVQAQVYNGFQGTPTVAFSAGGTVGSVAQGGQVDLGTATRATINWVPDDHATGGGAIDFLPANRSQAFVGSGSGPQTVLNRILPTDSTRAIALNGAISTASSTNPDIRVWVYSAGGILIGQNASINVGGLVLTTADPSPSNTNGTGDFMPVDGQFTLTGAANSTSAITIANGAQINAIAPNQSNYILAFAPQIAQHGAITVNGTAALVAGESASFAIDAAGLFTISMTTGSAVTSNTLVQDGTISGDAAANSIKRRIYLMAMPKNNAIAQVIVAGGSLGFDVAGAAAVDDNAIVLSSGQAINDTGTGNPVTSGAVGQGSVTINGGTFTSQVYAGATQLAAVTLTGNATFNAGLQLQAPTANVDTGTHMLNVTGDMLVAANADLAHIAGSATVFSSGSLTVGGALTVSADNTYTGIGGGALQGPGGASVTATAGGAITVAGLTRVSAVGNFQNAVDPAFQSAAGGMATMTASGGGTITLGGMNIDAQANGQASGTPATMGATGGTVIVQATGAGSHITSAGDLSLYAGGSGGSDMNSGTGGYGHGGTATVMASSGGTLTLQTGSALSLDARGYGSNNGPQTPADAGSGTGGTANLSAIDGTIESPDHPKISLDASAYGGSANGAGGNGGSAAGGTAQLTIGGTTGQLNLNSATQNGGGFVMVSANGTAGASQNGAGGAANGGRASMAATGTGQVITAPQIDSVTLSAVGIGGDGSGANGGDGTGGLTQLSIGGGTTYLQTGYDLELNAQARGGYSGGTGGNATAGTVAITVAAGGTLTQTDQVLLSANSVRGAGGSTDGSAIGGTVLVQNAGTLNLDTAGSGLHIDTGGTTGLGYTEISTAGTGTTIIGPNQSAGSGDILINDHLINADLDPIKISAAGNLTLTANGVLISGFGDHIDLIADNKGTGSGVVTLPANSISQTTDGTVSVYSNPTALGSPTDYSTALSGGYGTITSYQLVNTVTQLQQVGNFLTQNFALGRDIDASVTQTWNGGAGFVPIGTSGTPFVGNFSGLGHQISGLTIHGLDYVGLFGLLDAGASITNLGLVNASISGRNYVGGIVGQVLVSSSGTARLSQDFVTSSQIASSGAYIGGLVGFTAAPGGGSVVVQDSHADIVISVTGGATYATAGGLIGMAAVGQIDRSFATGSITSTSRGSIGGLVGVNNGTITDSYATTTVSAPTGAFEVGGLAGANYGTLSRVYATGAITAGSGSSQVGGLVGLNSSGISEGLASGAITAPGGTLIGGLVGDARDAGSNVQNSYWDVSTTGQNIGVYGAYASQSTNLNPVGGNNPNPYLPTSYGNLSTGNWTFLPGGSRPIGAWEVPTVEYGVATISSAHQVQLIGKNLGGSYRLGQTIDMSGTSSSSDIWSPSGFQTIGQLVPGVSFTGTLNGQGHSLLNLRIAANGTDAALIEENQGTISDIGLYNAQVSTVSGTMAGALAALNYGTISGSYATGSVSGGTALTGGLVGYNGGGISNSYASVAVTGGASSLTGGLVGQNGGTIGFAYANGPVAGGAQIGGLVGSASGGSITQSYWNTSLYAGNGCGTGAGSTCSGLTGLTTAQMTNPVSFTGWSIANSGGQGLIWRIYDGSTTPLLTRFLQIADTQVSDAMLTYTGAPLGVPVAVIGADPSHIYGTPTYSGNGRNAGTYSVSYTGGLYSDQLGYDIVASPGTANLTITPAMLTLTATPDSRSYNAGTASSGQVAVAGLLSTDTASGLTQTFDSANVGNRILSVANGYVISDGNNGGNYTVTTYGATGSISQAALTLAAVASGKSYDATTASSATVQVTGLQGNDSVSGLSQQFDNANAGNRALTVAAGYMVNDGNGGGNYAVSLTDAAGVITPATLTLAAATDGKTYDATTTSTGQVQASGLKGSDTITGLTQMFDSANAGNRALGVANGYTVNDGNGGGNYIVSLTNAAGVITPATLMLAAVADSRTYTAAVGSSGQVQISGLKGSDTVSGLAQSFESANAGSRILAVANGYVINDGNGGGNYRVTSTTASGVISPAALTLAAAADSKVYDATTVSSAQVQIIGLKGLDAVTGLSEAFDSVNAGSRILTVTGGYVINDGNGGGNYTVSRTQASGQITPAELLLTAASDSRTYDATAGSTGQVLVMGLKGTDTVTGLTQAFDSANAGARMLSVSAGYTVRDGNGGGNYAVSLAAASGRITPASLTVTYTATRASSVYGDALGALSGTAGAAGFLGGDTAASTLSGTAAFAVIAGSTSPVGTYAVLGSGLTSTGNYQVNAVQAAGNASALSITARSITVTADSQGRAQGFANPALTYTVVGPNAQSAGLVNGDRLSGGLATSATNSSPAGSYAITQGTLAATSNYALNYVGANLTITPGVTIADLQQLPQAAQTIAAVTPNITAQTEATPEVTPTAEEQKEEQKAVASSTKPAAVRAILINDGTVAIPQPVDEAVTSNGSSGLWAPK